MHDIISQLLKINSSLLSVIYQRQIQKNNLASFSEDAKVLPKRNVKNKSTRFTPEELKDCFTLKENCICDTKNKLGAEWMTYGNFSSILSLLFPWHFSR